MKSLAVYLSPLAEFKLNLILQYLENEWGIKSKTSFLDKLEKTINQLSKHPNSFQESEKWQVYINVLLLRKPRFIIAFSQNLLK